MCLSVKNGSRVNIASKDINVFKVLIKQPDGKIITPYLESEILIGETKTSDLYKSRIDEVRVGLHSFATAKSVALECDFHLTLKALHCGCTVLIVRAVIPKGSKYYVGIYDNHKAYASDTLTYNKIIKEFKV